MAIYKRVTCPQCSKGAELRNGDDRLKRITCHCCGISYAITPDNAVYYIDYCFDYKRFREKVGNNKAIAEAVLAKRKVEILEGKFFDIRRDEKIKFGDFAREYLENYSKQHKRSWATDSYHIADFNAFFRNKYLSEITAKDIENFKSQRIQKVSASTVNRQLALLKSMMNNAVVSGKLQDNPMKSIKLFKEPQGRLRFLEKEEIIKLIANCNKSLAAIVVIAIYTGMRKGEILKLQWQDIDFKRKCITLLETKNGEARIMPMNSKVSGALLNIVKNPASPYVFCNKRGKKISDIRKSFATALRKSGIIGFRFHDLRHTFASQLVMVGSDLNTVRELMGHKGIAMTLRYSHLASSHKQRAVDMLGEAIDTNLPQELNVEVSDRVEELQAIGS